mmetsp:Transcript_104474/g.180021  ORF Transcript_104474/g.180021 Transcript_104474/m.180021 type:complete len:119 (-) Transcript_104474:541-897(-)
MSSWPTGLALRPIRGVEGFGAQCRQDPEFRGMTQPCLSGGVLGFACRSRYQMRPGSLGPNPGWSVQGWRGFLSPVTTTHGQPPCRQSALPTPHQHNTSRILAACCVSHSNTQGPDGLQ